MPTPWEKGLCVGHWNVGSPHLQFSVLNTNDEDLWQGPSSRKKCKKISCCPWFKLWTSVGGGEDKLDKAACTVVKGIASRDEYFFEGPKYQNSAFWLGGGCWWFSQFLTGFLPIKSKQKFLLAFIKSVTNCESLSGNPFSGILFRLSDSLLI